MFRIIIIIIPVSGDDSVLLSNEPATSSWFCVLKRHLCVTNCWFGFGRHTAVYGHLTNLDGSEKLIFICLFVKCEILNKQHLV